MLISSWTDYVIYLLIFSVKQAPKVGQSYVAIQKATKDFNINHHYFTLHKGKNEKLTEVTTAETTDFLPEPARVCTQGS